jgi:hypothetical protein
VEEKGSSGRWNYEVFFLTKMRKGVKVSTMRDRLNKNNYDPRRC